MKSISRRNFLKTSAIAAGALSLPARSWSQVVGANDAIRVAVIGFNGRGKDALSHFTKKDFGTRVVALCDVDKNVLSRETESFKGRGENVEGYLDYRKLLENKN